jgi:glycosyltransferase involved in cell wall biosynthesis
VPAEAVADVLAGAAVGWLPFQPTPNNARAIPLKLLEYMAAGLPVVASDVGVSAAIVRREGCGLVVPPDDPEAHARALARLLSDADAARTLGGRGRRAVAARYTWEAEAKRLLELYAELAR